MTTDNSSENNKQSQLDSILVEIAEKHRSYTEKLSLIGELNSEDKFKLLSKPTRNALIHGLLDDMTALEETTKILFRALKKVKRARAPDSVIDELLGVPEHLRGSGGDFDDQPFGKPLEE